MCGAFFIRLNVAVVVVATVETVCIGACWFLCFSLIYDLDLPR